ncbi:hypothetical protein Ocin01_10086 [Orchesella cincta]|uniref:DUF7920 domain-containing protein n=1 Tax=Orchesella cincta TaxID=48709 RepID=A0A1D2MUL3_ORCCI|nr:hypothetical protein Ocin01_10086 [Orchesella cincta]
MAAKCKALGGNHREVAMENSDAVKRWVDWCRSHPQLKCVEWNVPYGILPKNYRGVLIDVKVGSMGMPDDKIYLAHAELRAKVARGNCVLELSRIKKGKIVNTNYTFLIFALKKYSGFMGDEGDSPHQNSEWEPYFMKPLSTTRKIICTEKANGEAAQISSQKLLDQDYFCIGSKNVHMLLRNRDDIRKYGNIRFNTAKEVAHVFFETFVENTNIPENSKTDFISFIQNHNFTTVFEMVQPDNQHIVKSDLEHPELKFICWTMADIMEDFRSKFALCAMPIDEAIEQARKFRLTTVTYEATFCDSAEDVSSKMESCIRKVQQEFGHEGKVLYFLDSENCTIGLIKKKTAWYVILRSLREKVASFNAASSSIPMPDRLSQIASRIKEIQSWLGFSNKFTEGWSEICTAFAEFVAVKSPSGNDIRTRFPTLFNEFLKDNQDCKTLYNSLQGTF